MLRNIYGMCFRLLCSSHNFVEYFTIIHRYIMIFNVSVYNKYQFLEEFFPPRKCFLCKVYRANTRLKALMYVLYCPVFHICSSLPRLLAEGV